MKIKLIYPKWPKLKNQPEFNLPPHGPVCFAATIPSEVEVSFCDENVETLDFNEAADLICISVMLTCQMPRAWQIADSYRKAGRKVLFGGIATMLHYEETAGHADSVFLGETEGRMEEVIKDFKNGRLKKVYNYLNNFPDTNLIGTARRDILNRPLYNFRGVQMVDLVHASRGCRFNCFPCCTPYLGGRQFRPRPINLVVSELESIKNNRLFIVDNSLAQNDEWEKELFKAIAPLKKKWVSHPIKDNDEILDLAVKAGCWYVYQAVVDTSEHIRKKVKRLQERGIGVEGTIILGMDDHDEDYIKRLIDFLLEIKLDLAEFTILTPFMHTPIRAQMEKEGRILHNNWINYTGGEVVFKPAKMSVDSLQKMYEYAWNTFYSDYSKEVKMAKLYLKVIEKEKLDGTYSGPALRNRSKWGKQKP
ncbi:MAG TPA: radical SAM protein [Candidatus Omnitrophota bacterium]|nr:radical SAM protein [Candidatus Omnitrophota bacterium]HPT39832.1 radical SAM protein [Candidatus Omnitrophota bacterium]